MWQNLQTQKYNLLPLKESENNQKINQDIITKPISHKSNIINHTQKKQNLAKESTISDNLTL